MVYDHLADGFEEVEALTIVDVLRRAGVDVETVSMMEDSIVTGAHGINVEADIIYEETDYTACEMIVLPGGGLGAENLEAHQGLAKHIKCFADNGKLLAAICAAPMVFGTHGVIKGKKATIYPSMEDKLTGAEATGENVTVDGNVITGKGPATAMEFALTLAEILKGKETADEVAEGLLYSRA